MGMCAMKMLMMGCPPKCMFEVFEFMKMCIKDGKEKMGMTDECVKKMKCCMCMMWAKCAMMGGMCVKMTCKKMKTETNAEIQKMCK